MRLARQHLVGDDDVLARVGVDLRALTPVLEVLQRERVQVELRAQQLPADLTRSIWSSWEASSSLISPEGLRTMQEWLSAPMAGASVRPEGRVRMC
jgi:hypothetical protein